MGIAFLAERGRRETIGHQRKNKLKKTEKKLLIKGATCPGLCLNCVDTKEDIQILTDEGLLKNDIVKTCQI